MAEGAEEAVAEGVEDLHVEAADEGAEETEEQVEEEFAHVGEVELGDGEDVREAEQSHVDRVGDDGADDAGDEGVALEVLAIEDFDAGDGAAEGGAEDRPQATGGTGQEEDAPLGGRQFETSSQPAADPGADLRERPLLTARTAAGQSDDGGERLDQGDDGADDAAAVVEGVDHGVAARSFGLGGKAVGQVAAEKSTGRRQEEKQP